MDHSLAIEIFKEIQARPYNLSLTPGESCNNCYFKGIELLQRIGELGYTVRGRGGVTYWDENIFGQNVVGQLPKDFMITHFFVELYLDNEWRIIDPSFQIPLQEHGLTIGSWENGQSCFPLTKIFTQQEFHAYLEEWLDKDYQTDFFERGRPTWQALNAWFLERS